MAEKRKLDCANKTKATTKKKFISLSSGLQPLVSPTTSLAKLDNVDNSHVADSSSSIIEPTTRNALDNLENKIKSKIEEASLRKRKRIINKENFNQDRTPCVKCKVIFCEGGRNWIEWQEYHKWYHNTCQGLEEIPSKFFVCTCENNSE